jgi:NTP pyrophosphatase (non-canonical NTP hydrolase)
MIVDQERIIKLAKDSNIVWNKLEQISHFHEEMGELMTAISQHRRGRIDREAVQEEIADVIIMAFAVADIYGMSGVSKFIEEKTQLTEDRIKQEMNK